MADEIKQVFEDLTNKRCRTCAVCGKPENDGLLFDDSAWICNDCRAVLGQLRGCYIRSVRNKEKSQQLKNGLTNERARLLIESWFCNFCPNKGQPCMDTLASERQCVNDTKLAKIGLYIGHREFPLIKNMKVNRPRFVQVREQETCDNCGREFPSGNAMARVEVYGRTTEDEVWAHQYIFCPMCAKMLLRKAERAEQEGNL